MAAAGARSSAMRRNGASARAPGHGTAVKAITLASSARYSMAAVA